MSFSRIGPYGPMGRDTMKNWGLPLGGLALLGLVLQILLGSDPAEKPLGHPLAKVITATEPGSSPPAPPHRHRAPATGPDLRVDLDFNSEAKAQAHGMAVAGEAWQEGNRIAPDGETRDMKLEPRTGPGLRASLGCKRAISFRPVHLPGGRHDAL
jgi:hypothetical protein